MNTQEIILKNLVEGRLNHAYHDDNFFECYITRTRDLIDLKLDQIKFTPPTKGGPLSEEGENVVFRSGLRTTVKVGDMIVNIAKNMSGAITYYVIVLKKPIHDYSWIGYLEMWGLEPLISGS